jgi:hypothetical protein
MDKHLRETLEQIHVEIEKTKFVDAGDEAVLRELMEDIRRLLEGAEQRSEHRESIRERLTHTIDRFEETHPTLAANMGRVAEALGRLAV